MPTIASLWVERFNLIFKQLPWAQFIRPANQGEVLYGGAAFAGKFGIGEGSWFMMSKSHSRLKSARLSHVIHLIACSLASLMNIAAFKLGNSIGKALGGFVIYLELWPSAVVLTGAVAPAMGLVLCIFYKRAELKAVII